MMELQQIFVAYEKEYREMHKLSRDQEKALFAIKNCRTEIYGKHVDVCGNCGNIKISYNSCRNRHCPKCQTLAKERWINDRKEELMPVQYFHTVFTIPEELNAVVFQNKKLMYGILMKASAETMQELAEDKKYLGGQIGITSIIHTWGQTLTFHPHIHMIVPGGALTKNKKWIKSKDKFFIPVKVLSRKFKGKFMSYFKEVYNKLDFFNEQKHLYSFQNFQNLVNDLYKKEWVVYCKKPFKNSTHVIEYLGRYTHRVAISNNRIVSFENGKVTFKWRDYKDNNKEKLMTLDVVEFMRRFFTHILIAGFTKIRHYGFLGNRNKNTKLRLCQKLTGGKLKDLVRSKISTVELIYKLTGRDITKCSSCNTSKLKEQVLETKMNPSPANL